jgi:hypothetical protein
MSRSRIAAAVLCVTLGATVAVRADVREDQKTKFQLAGAIGKLVNMFGGRGAREGVDSTVAVKGNRKSTITGDNGQIVDLTEEKIYDLDLKRKTYTVVTFAEFRRRMEEAKKKAEEDARKAEAERKDSPKEAPPAEARKEEPQVDVDFDVRNTGETKMLNGFNTHQSIMTITVREKGKTLEQSGGLVMTTDLWLTPRTAAMNEVQEFDLKYAQKLLGPVVAGASPRDMASAMAMYPQMKPALERMRTETTKLDGTPILTTITMDAVASAEDAAAQKKQSDTDSRPSPAKGIGGLLGGLAKKTARKDDEPAKSRATFLTTSVEVVKLTTDVSAADVALPAGFTEAKQDR